MKRRPALHLVLSIACAVSAGCQGLARTGADPEGVVALDGRSTATLKFSRHTLHIHGADGKPLANVAVLLGGKIYQVGPSGGLLLGRDAVPPAGDTALILVPGYAPLRMPTGSDADLTLEPAAPVAVAKLPGGGGEVRSADGRLVLDVPAGMLSDGTTAVELSAYTPSPDAAGAAAGARDALAAKLGQTACDQPLPCPPITTSLGVLVSVAGTLSPGTLRASVDLKTLLRGWNGQAPEPWVAAPDAWSTEDRNQALAAARIVKTFAAIDATNNPAWRAALSSQYGLTEAQGVLSFSATIADGAVHDGLVKVQVDGVGVLGTLIEVTIVSAVAGYLPPGAAQPGLVDPSGAGPFAHGLIPPATLAGAAGGTTGLGTGVSGTTVGGTTVTTGTGTGVTGTGTATGSGSLITENGAGLITENGAGLIGDRSDHLISDLGSGLITENGAGIIANNGGNLITENGAGIVANNGGSFAGTVRVPFAQLLSKYHQLTYTDYPWQGVTVRAVNAFGFPYGTTTANTNATGQYTLTGVANSAPIVFVEADTHEGYRLASLATAPGNTAITSNLDAATTGMTCLVADEIQNGRFLNAQINMGGYADDMAYLEAAFVQADAQYCVAHKVDEVAAYVRNFFKTRGIRPETIMQVSDVGPAIPFLYKLTTDPAGNVLAIGNNQLHRITPAGADSVVASLSSPFGVALDAAGNAYVSDSGSHQIFQITPAGVSSVYAGAAAPGWNASGTTNFADGDAATARFGQPDGLAFGPTGKLYVADFFNFRVRQIDAAVGPTSPSFVTTVAGGGPTSPNAIFLPSNVPPPVDGLLASARFGQVTGLAVGPAGEFYVVDVNNQRIRMVKNGVVSTLAGGANGTNAGYADGPAASALFNYPQAIAVDKSGLVYVADTGNNCIRKIDTALAPTDPRFVTTIAGTPTAGYAGGTLAATRFNGPYGIWVDANGVIYVGDQGNQHIRVLK